MFDFPVALITHESIGKYDMLRELNAYTIFE